MPWAHYQHSSEVLSTLWGPLSHSHIKRERQLHVFQSDYRFPLIYWFPKRADVYLGYWKYYYLIKIMLLKICRCQISPESSEVLPKLKELYRTLPGRLMCSYGKKLSKFQYGISSYTGLCQDTVAGWDRWRQERSDRTQLLCCLVFSAGHMPPSPFFSPAVVVLRVPREPTGFSSSTVLSVFKQHISFLTYGRTEVTDFLYHFCLQEKYTALKRFTKDFSFSKDEEK